MDQSAETNPTLRALLLQTVATTPIGSGIFADVYRFPLSAKGMEDYVLRVEEPVLWDKRRGARRTFEEALKNTTSLVPVRKLITGIQIGQPIAKLNNLPGVTILRRQPGESMGVLGEAGANEPEEHQPKGYYDIDYVTAFIERIIKLPTKNGGQNPFIPVLTMIPQIMRRRYDLDYGYGNLMIDDDTGQLHVIDQTMSRLQGTLSEERYKKEIAFEAKMFRESIDRLPERFIGAPSKKLKDLYSAIANVQKMITKAEEKALETVHTVKTSYVRFERQPGERVTLNTRLDGDGKSPSFVERLQQWEHQAETVQAPYL